MMPFQIYDDIFSDYVGFKFFDGAKELSYYIESESNCNYIIDKNINTGIKTLAVFPNGNFAVYNSVVKKMQLSTDNGSTWTDICTNITGGIPYRILIPDSNNNLFVASIDGFKLYKYTSADNYQSGTEVIDMTSDNTKIGSILAEDSLGNLYLGTYQETPWNCTIRKSTDHGDTWEKKFSTTESQHVHNIFINKKVTPNIIFVGVDNHPAHSYYSTDYGDTWTEFTPPFGNRDYAFRYAGENFYIGCGERLYLGGSTMYKTSDFLDSNAYYSLFDNGQGMRDIANVIEDSDDVLIAGGCVGNGVGQEQIFLSEDRGETWKTVYTRPYNTKQAFAGKGLRTFMKRDGQIIAETYEGNAMRFSYGNGAKTILTFVNVGDIPTSGKTITLKTGYMANIEYMRNIYNFRDNVDGKVLDIRVEDGYVIDKVSNKRVLTDKTSKCVCNTNVGLTSECKNISNYSYRLNEQVNLGTLSRLNFRKGFTISFLFKKEDDKNYLLDNTEYLLLQWGQNGNLKIAIKNRSLIIKDDYTSVYGQKLYIADPYLDGNIDGYVRITAYFTKDDLPKANIFTESRIIGTDDIECISDYTGWTIPEFSKSDLYFGSIGMPNIPQFEIYNRVLTYGEILGLGSGVNLITDGCKYN